MVQIAPAGDLPAGSAGDKVPGEAGNRYLYMTRPRGAVFRPRPLDPYYRLCCCKRALPPLLGRAQEQAG